MASFFLIHGGLHGAWCWREVIELLEARGHVAVATDQPGVGDDPTPPTEVTWESTVAKILADFERLPGPAIVVGHSSGSTIAAQLADARSERVTAVVHVAGTLPVDGESCADVLALQANPVNVLTSETFAQDGVTLVRPLDTARLVLYTDCSDDVVASALGRLRVQPLSVFTGAVALSAEREGAVPSHYVECLRDVGITPGFQRWMYRRRACERVFALDCGHCPMLSVPGALTDVLLEVPGRDRAAP